MYSFLINILVFVFASIIASVFITFFYHKERKADFTVFNKLKYILKFKYLIPVINILYLKKKDYCYKKSVIVNLFYAELISGIIAVLLINSNIFGVYKIILFLILTFFITYDFINYNIPVISLSIFLIINISYFILFYNFEIKYLFSFLFSIIIFFIIYFISKKKIGLGDILFIIFLSFLFTVQEVCIFLIISSLTGILFSFISYLINKENTTFLKTPVPFLPFLTIGFSLVLFLKKYNFINNFINN